MVVVKKRVALHEVSKRLFVTGNFAGVTRNMAPPHVAALMQSLGRCAEPCWYAARSSGLVLLTEMVPQARLV